MSTILIGKSDSAAVELDARFGNRHGMIAGATGTGKTVSLMVLAEGFSRLGVPVVLADVKGDMAGLAKASAPASDKLQARLDKLGLKDWEPQANPVIFWDLYGELGHPVRTTISEMGPNLLARVMELNDTQEGVLEVIFKVADDNGWLMLDLDDLHSMLVYAADERKAISGSYGLISTSSIGAVQRGLLRLRQQDADKFFGEPALELTDLMRQDMSGNGIINVLAANKLILKPKLYSTFLLWLLSELFEQLPEVGDPDQPKLVFFFDEAHLLFDDCPPALRQRVEQVVRLIRSKGVGVYFCSQNPDDVPNGTNAKNGAGLLGKIKDLLFGTKRRQGMLEALAKSASHAAGSQLGRQILRDVLGGISRGGSSKLLALSSNISEQPKKTEIKKKSTKG